MKNRGSLYVGILLLAFGGLFLVAQLATDLLAPFEMYWGWGRLWPFLILFIGLAFWLPVFIWWEKRRQVAGLAVPGTIVVVNGLMLLYQAITRDWGSWSYLWSMEPIAVALGLLALYWLGPRERGLLVAAGIVGGIGLFFFVIFVSIFGGWLRFLVPVVVMVVGLLLLLRGIQDRGREDLPPAQRDGQEWR
jgi:hypothetical protein